jgi:hypothetical protein
VEKMDPNLYFRFIVPPWAGAIAAFAVNWALGGNWIDRLSDGQGDAPWLALFAALLASPAAGFLLNTVVVGACHRLKCGPEYSAVFRDFKDRVQQLVGTMDFEPMDRLAEAVKSADAAEVVAHFEYRTDPAEQLAWRRRGRAAFFVNWSSVLAIALGVVIGASLNSPDPVRSILVFLFLAILVVALLYNARASSNRIEGQQRIWAASWTNPQIQEFLTQYGTGLGTLRGSREGGSEGSDAPEESTS